MIATYFAEHDGRTKSYQILAMTQSSSIQYFQVECIMVVFTVTAFNIKSGWRLGCSLL